MADPADPQQIEEPTEKRHDVFFSYSRSDGEFVRRLQDAFRDRGHLPWVDWEDIAPSAEWLAEILAAIDGTDAFISIMSPDSVASAVCRQELDRAVDGHKRIVPVVRRDVDPLSVPEELARRNWLFFREGDDFAAALDQLIEAVETDLDRVKQHTALLVRARDWEAAGRDNGKLLRGSDLAVAEGFLRSPAGGVVATELQERFVAASRLASSRRLRSVVVAVSLALVVSVGLGVVAWVQRGAAVSQERRAVAERDLARARALSASAVSQLEIDPELSLLLAVEASNIEQTPEVENALRLAVNASHIQRTLELGRTGINVHDVATTRDGAIVAASDALGLVHLWRDTGELAAEPIKGPGGSTARIDIDDTGRMLAISSFSEIELVPIDALDDDAARTTWPLPGSPSIVDIAFVPGGRSLVAVGHTIDVLDVRSGSVERLAEGDRWRQVAVSPDGSRAVVGGRSRVSIWDLSSGASLVRLADTGRNITGVAFSSDGRTVATSAADRTARLWNARSGEQIVILPHSAAVSTVAFGPRGTIATGDVNGVARLWDVRTREVVSTFIGHHDLVSQVVLPPDGDRLVSSAEDGTVRIWELGDGVPGSSIDDAVAAAFLPDGVRVAALSDDHRVRLIDPVTGEVLNTFDEGIRGPIEDPTIAIDPTGDRVAVPSLNGHVATWDLDTGDIRYLGPTAQRGTAVTAAFSPVGDVLVIGGVETFSGFGDLTAYLGTWDVMAGVPVTGVSIGGYGYPRERVAVSPDGLLVAVSVAGSPDGLPDSARIFDLQTGDLIDVLEGHSDYVMDVDFDASGSTLLTTSWDGTAKLWDVSTGSEIVTLEGHRGPVMDGAFSADGRLVVTASQDGTVRVWTLDGEQVVLLRSAVEPTAASFSPDGRSILTVGDGGMRIYSCRICVEAGELARLARDQLTRPLTEAERDRFLE